MDERSPHPTRGTVAIVWRGDAEARCSATPQNNRFHRIFEELEAQSIHAEPAVYDESFGDEVRVQLLAANGVLVWVDPIHQGKTRVALDTLLRDVAARGPWVSAHPDVILKMGVKEVLYRTRHLGWGTDTHLYRTVAEFSDGFQRSLDASGPRVVKQNRGNGGQGVWKVERVRSESDGAVTVRVLHAQRGSVPECMPLRAFIDRCQPYFSAGGCVVDQPFQERLPEGKIRCYMGCDKVVGFGNQLIKALIPPPPEGPDSPSAQPGPRIMHGPDAAPFQRLRARMEEEWTPQMMQVLGIAREALPIIWDADFLYGPPDASGEDTFVLCEINASSCFAIPDQAPADIARLTARRLRGGRWTSRGQTRD
ncbi:MAG: Cj0069 family protein [Rhodospirillaceae bacterium]